MSMSILEGKIAADVANDGTFTVNYPTGKDAGHFLLGVGHKIAIQGNDVYTWPMDLFLTFGASNITVKNKSGTTWPAGSNFRLQLEELGDRYYLAGGQAFDRNKAGQLPQDVPPPELAASTWKGEIVVMSLGAPKAVSTTAIAAAQTTAGAGNLTLTATPYVMDVPRNFSLTVATTDQSGITFTVTGRDVYGRKMVETLAGPNANTVLGKKAFKEIDTVHASAAVATNGVSVGFGKVLGLPVHLPNTALVLRELWDLATVTNGTFVAGVKTEGGASATDGDVRGTLSPNAAPDGEKASHVIAVLPDATYLGIPQYAG